MTPGKKLVTLVAMAFLMTGCSTSPDPPQAADGYRLTEVREKYAEITDRDPLDLENVRLPPPRAPYTKSDVEALAQQAIRIAEASYHPKLSKLEADDAVDSVLRDEKSETVDEYLSRVSASTYGYPWQWAIASRYDREPTEVKFIRAAWKSELISGELDGKPGKYLAVTLQVHGVQAADSSAIPTVVRRTIRLGAWRPRGGPEWWPGLTISARAYGADDCRLIREPVLSSPDDSSDAGAELAELEVSLRGGRVKTETETSESAYKKFAKECEAE